MKEDSASSFGLRRRIASFSSPYSGKSFALSLAMLAIFMYPSKADIIKADFEPELPVNSRSTIQMALVSMPAVKAIKTSKTIRTWITAYSSTPDQTDDTPFETANGSQVYDGVVASNFLPFGTKVKIPSVFGDKVFVVEDRMHPKYSNRMDIWMSDTDEALRFGKRYLDVAILN